jgi:hypothetical protein
MLTKDWLDSSPFASFVTPFVHDNKELGHPKELVFSHRAYWREHALEFDYFLWLSDDLILPLRSFLFYEKHYRELWELGWLFAFVRAEIPNGPPPSNDYDPWPFLPTARSADHAGILIDQPLYQAPSGVLYAEMWGPQNSAVALDRAQVLALSEEDVGLWDHGYTALPNNAPLERIDVGFSYRFTGRGSQIRGDAKSWRIRVLSPLGPDLQAHPQSLAWHLTHYYADSQKVYGEQLRFPGYLIGGLGSIPVQELFRWTKPPHVVPLMQRPNECTRANSRLCVTSSA